MRKIISEEERKKKEARNRTIVGIVLAAILLFSTAGYFVSDFTRNKNEKIIYNNIEFKQDENGYWHFSILGRNYVTFTNPYQTENISILTIKAIGDYRGKPLYFETSSSQIAVYEISKILSDIVERINYACMDENCSEYAIKNCSSNIIIIKMAEGNRSFINDKENCVYINYIPGEEEKAVDAFIFRILGIK